MKDNKNLFLAVVIMLGFLFLWEGLVARRYAPPTKPATRTTAVTDGAKTITHDAPAPTVSAPKSAAAPASAPSDPVRLAAGDTEVLISPYGASAVSWRVQERAHWVEFIMPAANRTVLPLETFPELRFTNVQLSSATGAWEAMLPSGLRLRKTIELEAQPPFHRLTLTFTNTTAGPVEADGSLGWQGLDKHSETTPAMPAERRPFSKNSDATLLEQRAVAYDGKPFHWRPGVIFGRTIDQRPANRFAWTGVDNDHFLFALLPKEGAVEGLRIAADRSTVPLIKVPVRLTLAPGETRTVAYDIYLGPKKYADLAALGRHLESSVDFGAFSLIAKLFLRILQFFHSFTGNYGWAIILLTLCIQVLVFPLTKSSFQHSARMKDLAPQMKKLQEAHKSDPKRLQIETMNLYKKAGLRFMGMEGCFPMLLQIPIFFAFYTTLRLAYELRGAPWIFWIHDLAAKDPYYVLPVLMGVGMFVQQKISAAAMDPAQARMMMLMPVFFTFMFLNLPSGLVLYWTVNSICSILIQQTMIWRQHRAAPPAPAEA